MWRVLAPGGLLFARLATTAGQPTVKPLGGGRYVMPDGGLDIRLTLWCWLLRCLLRDTQNAEGG